MKKRMSDTSPTGWFLHSSFIILPFGLRLWLLVRRGRGLGRRGLALAGRGVAFRQKMIEFPTVVGIHLGLGEELFGLFGFALGEHLETIFREQIILQFGFRRL